VQVKDSDAKDEADETSAEKHKGKSYKTDPGCNGNYLFLLCFMFMPWLVFSNTDANVM
jgi:hypothetical protein